jgi:hypothetical protein
MPESALTLTASQAEKFKADGYLGVDPFVPLDEIERMRVIYDAMFNGGYKLEDGDFFDLATTARAKDAKKLLPQIMNPGGYEPKLRQTLYYRRAEAIALQMLGPGAKFAFDHFIDKPIGIAHETPWHQDQGYWDKAMWGKERAVNFWLSLDQASLDNGCMQYVPHSHQGPILDHSHVSKNPDIHGLVCEMPDELRAQAQAVPLAPGGVAMHWHNTLHYAGPNRTQNRRRAYIMVFNHIPA